MIIAVAQNLLEDAGYAVTRCSGALESIVFEDAAVVGKLVVCGTAYDIVTEWHAIQDAFLRDYAADLRRFPEKVWNMYLALLTADTSDAVTQRRLNEVEEDFSGMRKIAAAGVISATDVSHALAPLLPLSAVTLENDSLEERIRKALAVHDRVLGALEAGEVDAVVAAFLEDQK